MPPGRRINSSSRKTKLVVTAFPPDKGKFTTYDMAYTLNILAMASMFLHPVLFFGIFFISSFGTLYVNFPELNATSLSNIFKTDDTTLNQQLSSLFGSLTDYTLSQYSSQRIYSHLFCFAQVNVDHDDIIYGCSPAYGFKVGYFIERLVPSNLKEPILAAYQSISKFDSIRTYGNLHMVILWLVKLCLGIPMFIAVYIMIYQMFYLFEDKKDDYKAFKYILANTILLGVGSLTLLLMDISIMAIVNKHFSDWGFHANFSIDGNVMVWSTFFVTFLQLCAQYHVVYNYDIFRAVVKLEIQKARNGEYDGREIVVIDSHTYRYPDGFLSEVQAKKKEEKMAKIAEKERKKEESQAKREQKREMAEQLRREREEEKKAIKERQEEERQMRLEEQGRLKAMALEEKREKEAERIRMCELAQAERQAQEEERKQRERERALAKEQARAEAAMIAEAKVKARIEKNKPAYTQEDVDNDDSSFYAINEIHRYQDSVAYPKSARTKSTGYPQSYEPSRRTR